MMSRGPYPILLMLAMSMPGAVRALGLGDIRVDSALDEPLSAQIDIVGATRDDLAALTASVANREIFQRYGADRPSFLSTASFKVGMNAQGRPVLQVRSADAFTDPLVSFLVDLRWGKNEIVREYSLLLDPPNYKFPLPASEVALAATVPSAATAAAPASEGGASQVPRGRLTHATHAARASDSSHTDAPAIGQDRVRVASGDTLRGIARRAGARSETDAQTLMIAIFRANPSAFDGNINRLHRGAVLTIPTSTELAAVSSGEAKREVRAQMTAWRLDGRPSAAPRVAMAANPLPATASASAATDPSIDASLKNRVQSLEQQLDDMHKQLADENARLQSLKDSALEQPAVPAPQPAALQQPAVPAPQPAAPAVAADTAELVNTPIIAAAQPQKPNAAAAGTAAQTPKTSKAEIFGPVAVTLGLLLAGFAYIRRRLVSAPQPAGGALQTMTMPMPEIPEMPAMPPVQTRAAALVVAPAKEALEASMSPLQSFRPAVRSADIEAPRHVEPAIADTVEQPTMLTGAETASGLEIDIEALERSYLESLPGELSAADDPALADTTTVETVSIDTHDLDAGGVDADLNTVLMDVKAYDSLPSFDATPHPAPTGSQAQDLDFNLVDLDETIQHVNMPSGLNDHNPEIVERRTNIVDVLKAAIERDPKRRDLRMKLLETYHSTASTNQRAFMDVVRKLSREKDLLTEEDWKKVTLMGREIAADDILFADLDPPRDGDDLAHCA